MLHINSNLKQALMPKSKSNIILDSAKPSAAKDVQGDYLIVSLRERGASIVMNWAETEAGQLAEGESLADRLCALVVGECDENMDGDISDEEADACLAICNCIADYIATKGVADSDIDALLNDWDAEAGDRVHDLLKTSLPQGDEAVDADIVDFAFDPDAAEAVFDAAYKNVMVVRGGQKMRIKKRISGHFKLTPKQKVALAKGRARSHSASAQMRRAKSLRIRRKSGL